MSLPCGQLPAMYRIVSPIMCKRAQEGELETSRKRARLPHGFIKFGEAEEEKPGNVVSKCLSRLEKITPNKNAAPVVRVECESVTEMVKVSRHEALTKMRCKAG